MFRKPIVILLQKLPRDTKKNNTSNVNCPLAQALFHRFNRIPDRLCNSSKVGKINRFRGLCGQLGIKSAQHRIVADLVCRRCEAIGSARQERPATGVAGCDDVEITPAVGPWDVPPQRTALAMESR